MKRGLVTAVLLMVASVAFAAPAPKLVLRETARFAGAGAAAAIPIMRVNFNPEGNLLVASSGGGEARVFELSGRLRGTYSGQRPPMFNANFSPSGTYLATT